MTVRWTFFAVQRWKTVVGQMTYHEWTVCVPQCVTHLPPSAGNKAFKSETIAQLHILHQQTHVGLLSHCKKTSFFALISVRNCSGLLNPVSMNALCEFGEPQHLFFFITALSVVGLIPFGRDMCTVK